MYWLIVLLLALLFYNLWKKEGYENYDDPSCLTLAKKNQGNLESLKEDIQSQLTLYFPNVIVGSLDIDSIPDEQQVNIILKYNIVDTGLTDTLEIAFT